MVLVILGIFVLILVAGIIIGCINDWYHCEGLFTSLIVVGIVGTLAAVIATVVLGVNCSRLSVIDTQIAMYQEENQKIELQLNDVVKQYQEYEKGTLTEFTPESSVTLVSLYPELKSDTLVQNQMTVYVKNNEAIKELKNTQILGDVYRWWLYFGGDSNNEK